MVSVVARTENMLDVFYKDIDKKRGLGAIICRGDYKLKLRDNLYALPIEYI